MAYSRGRCLLQPILDSIKKLTQAELSKRTGYSTRMISHFAQFDGKGNGKKMSPEAMYTISLELRNYIPEFEMSQLYDWIKEKE